MSQYIDLVCGDLKVLSPSMTSRKDAMKARRDIILEYQEICDPASAKGFVTEGRRMEQSKARHTVYTICLILLEGGHIDEVREIMTEMDPRCAKMTDSRLRAEVQSKSAKERLTLDKLKTESATDGDMDEGRIRLSYDRQTAALMSHFQFQIDPSVMKATVYASLVDRCTKELKARKEAYAKK